MAVFTRSVVTLTAVAGMVPVIAVAAGYRIRYEQAKEAGCCGAQRAYRVCDLPLYPTADTNKLKVDYSALYPSNPLEEGLYHARKAIQNFLGDFAAAGNTVKTTAKTSLDTSKASWKYVQRNSGELFRVALIAGFGIGGVFLGRKNEPWRSLTYGFLAAAPCALICYPKKIMGHYQSGIDFVRDLWQETIRSGVEYWPFREGEQNEAHEIPALATSDCCKAESTEKTSELENETGLFNPEDTDLLILQCSF